MGCPSCGSRHYPRQPDEDMLRHMAVKRLVVAPLLACSADLLVACSGDQAASSSAEGAAQRTSRSPATSPLAVPSSTFRYTDCDALVPGDAITFPDLTCECDDARQLHTMDCKSGVHVRLTGSTAADLEGITGSTPTWRAAEPIDSRGTAALRGPSTTA